MVMWSTQVALAIEVWRARSGAAAGRWLAAVGRDGGALLLAAYAFENRHDPFPEIVAGSARFEAEGWATR